MQSGACRFAMCGVLAARRFRSSSLRCLLQLLFLLLALSGNTARLAWEILAQGMIKICSVKVEVLGVGDFRESQVGRNLFEPSEFLRRTRDAGLHAARYSLRCEEGTVKVPPLAMRLNAPIML